MLLTAPPRSSLRVEGTSPHQRTRAVQTGPNIPRPVHQSAAKPLSRFAVDLIQDDKETSVPSEGEGLILTVELDRLASQVRHLRDELQRLHADLAAEHRMNTLLSAQLNPLPEYPSTVG